jgi:hypothetical protein
MPLAVMLKTVCVDLSKAVISSSNHVFDARHFDDGELIYLSPLPITTWTL